MADIIFENRPHTMASSDRISINNGPHGTIAHGVRVSADVPHRVMCISPLNTRMGTGNVYIHVPFDDVPELIRLLQYEMAGPLGKLAFEQEARDVHKRER